jgi:hypothetical protein
LVTSHKEVKEMDSVCHGSKEESILGFLSLARWETVSKVTNSYPSVLLGRAGHIKGSSGRKESSSFYVVI